MALCNLLYMTLHVTTGGSFPKPLTPKQERECLQKIKDGDEEARNTLIVHNLRLVAHIIKKYYSNVKDQDDLISIGKNGSSCRGGDSDNHRFIPFYQSHSLSSFCRRAFTDE